MEIFLKKKRLNLIDGFENIYLSKLLSATFKIRTYLSIFVSISCHRRANLSLIRLAHLNMPLIGFLNRVDPVVSVTSHLFSGFSDPVPKIGINESSIVFALVGTSDMHTNEMFVDSIRTAFFRIIRL